MPIDFECFACGKGVVAKDELAGKEGKCPHCGELLKVPTPVAQDISPEHAGEGTGAQGAGERTLPQDRIRDRAARLFEYLIKLAELRRKTIRNVNDYERVLWFHSVPREPECFVAAWGENTGGIDEAWLQIKKPQLRPPPAVPTEIRAWVRQADLTDSSQTPSLLPRIPMPKSEDSAGQGEPDHPAQFLELAEHPHVQKLWDKYVSQQWSSWAERNERAKKVQRPYSCLHSIYQQLKRQGEAFEFVLGLGLLTWETPTGQQVSRHLLVAEASVELDASNGTLLVKAGPDGAKLTLEEDMLEAHERPDAEEQQRIKDKIESIGDDVWGVDETKEREWATREALNRWVNSVAGGEGRYSDEMCGPPDFPSSPVVALAPALILRKRREQSLVTTYEAIRKRFQANANVSKGIRRVVTIEDHQGISEKASADVEKTVEFKDEFLPLPSNDEQLGIVRALEQTDGVLVQGPPGTGKSHTIANLICHLLATGRRVLVTSQTPRALRVLKDKIPEEIRALCVTLLGNDSSDLKDLEKSVRGITSRKYSWNGESNRAKIGNLNKERDQLRRQEAEFSRRLRELREKETYEHRICNGKYSGTAMRIAQRVSSERAVHGWLDVAVAMETEPPLTDEEALALVRLHRELTPERIAAAEKHLVNPQQLPGVEGFIQASQAERDAHGAVEHYSQERNSEIYPTMVRASREQLSHLRETLTELQSSRVNLLKSRHGWVPKAVEDVLSSQDQIWRDLLESSRSHLQRIGNCTPIDEEIQVELPGGHSRLKVIADARTLHAHLKSGGRLRVLFFFRPHVVKRCWYLVKETRINGVPCDTPQTLDMLLLVLAMEECLDKLWATWGKFSKRHEGSRTAQVAQMEGLCDCLNAVLNLSALVARAGRACSEIKGLPLAAWHDPKEVGLYLRCIEAAEAEKKLQVSRVLLNNTNRLLNECKARSNPHPVVTRIHEAVEKRNGKEYEESIAELTKLWRDHQLITQKRDLHGRLAQGTPSVAKQIEDDPNSADWDERFVHFTEAWRWAQAQTWLDKYGANANTAEIASELESVQGQILRTTANLAAALAWGHCLERLTESERAHLMAWAQRIEKIGKAKGKYAPLYRRQARENMDHCRSAIPAWVMPLYRVAENVTPGADVFDVVIIDEASQSGIDALFLQQLTKKIVVVGDDKQISPPHVGIPRDAVDELRNRYLYDFPLKSVLDLETSFFALGVIIYGNRIVLREHFRCVPEIIQFSNNLCYAPLGVPLMPLRQYPQKRLEPIRTVHVRDGYREGGNRNPLNRPEAEALVEKIAECCKDPRYKGKSMGVISLLGEYQARHIEGMLLERIGPEEIERRNLICGDAYAFQGDERDVMFLSMVAAPGETGIKALAGAADHRRFNVAASRAKDQMWLFHTPTLNDFRNRECVRYQLLEYCLNPKVQQADGARDNCESDFERAVYDRIIARGFRVIPQFEVAGYFIDLMVEGMERRLAVECDGDHWHSEPEQQEQDMRRQRQLERCGWTFWRVRGSDFYGDPDAALEGLWSTLDRLQIKPDSKEEPSAPSVDAAHDQPQVYTPIDDEAPTQGDSSIATQLSAAVEEEEAHAETTGPQAIEEAGWKPEQKTLLDETEKQITLFGGGERASLKTPKTPKRREQTPAQPPKAQDEELVKWVSRIPAEIWFAMSHWAKVNNLLQRWERSLTYNIGKRVGQNRGVTVKQARQAHRIYHEAVEKGFDEGKEVRE